MIQRQLLVRLIVLLLSGTSAINESTITTRNSRVRKRFTDTSVNTVNANRASITEVSGLAGFKLKGNCDRLNYQATPRYLTQYINTSTPCTSAVGLFRAAPAGIVETPVYDDQSSLSTLKNQDRRYSDDRHQEHIEEFTVGVGTSWEKNLTMMMPGPTKDVANLTAVPDSDDEDGVSPAPDFSMDLAPFQLLFTTTLSAMEEMQLLSVTKTHLQTAFEHDDSSFHRLEMFELPRYHVDMEKQKMVAFGGTAYYAKLDKEDTGVSEMVMLAFLGNNATRYVDSLRDAGMNVTQTQLYTLDGHAVDYKDGKMKVEVDSPNTMDGGMTDMQSWSMIGAAIGVPLIVLFMICLGFGYLQCRGYSLCGRKDVDPEGDVWKTALYEKSPATSVSACPPREEIR
jgi:hypothetical protein